MTEDHFLSRFNINGAVGRSELERFSAKSGVTLRDDYAEFMLQSNGGEGMIGESYAIFWPLSDLVNFNDAYQVDEFAPGLYLFGSNGGGEAFAFDLRRSDTTFVSVPFIGMALNEVVNIAPTFDRFIEALYSGDWLH